MTRLAVVIGASGGIGGALVERLTADTEFDKVVTLSRRSDPPLDLTDEATVVAAAAHVAALNGEVRLVIVATGILKDGATNPEKSWRELGAERLARQFAINAIGPALVMKHFLPLLPRQGRAVVACLSARVGSIGDNALGGWYGYRASKAALNQLVRTASTELARVRPKAILVALHPGTVATPLSEPFVGAGSKVLTPAEAAERLLAVIGGLSVTYTGGFIDQNGLSIPW